MTVIKILTQAYKQLFHIKLKFYSHEIINMSKNAYFKNYSIQMITKLK